MTLKTGKLVFYGHFFKTGATLGNPAENLAMEGIHKTPLWQLHRDLGAKMAPFAGYDMPVQYPDGVLKEHLHTRSHAGLFDVSHMGQAWLSAKTDPALLLEQIVPGDIRDLEAGKTRYTLLLNDEGGTVDDLMVTRVDPKTLFLVVNAGCKDKDFAYIRQRLPQAKLAYLESRALLALQGPKAETVLAGFSPIAASMKFMSWIKTNIDGHECYISRSGYTGEDGFEISVPGDYAVTFAKKLLADESVKPIGLGARDSLRLEAGLCLYGHELDETTTPVEANLKWVIGKRRREEANFAGAKTIMTQMKEGTKRLRVGIRPLDRAPVREHTDLHDEAGNKIGAVTSGGFGPSLNAPIAIAYVAADFAKIGTKMSAMVRGTPRAVEVAPLPFVQTNYKKD